jgi:hypothetical protein
VRHGGFGHGFAALAGSALPSDAIAETNKPIDRRTPRFRADREERILEGAVTPQLHPGSRKGQLELGEIATYGR